MATTPDYEATLEEVKAALKAICQIITPDNDDAPVDAEPYSVAYQRVAPPRWTMFFQRTAPIDNGTGEWRFDETVLVTYHTGYITEATPDVEAEAQRAKLAASVEFVRRPFLQSEGDYAQGVNGIHAEGVIVRDVAIVAGGSQEKQTLAVQVTLTIPLLFQLDDLDF